MDEMIISLYVAGMTLRDIPDRGQNRTQST